MLIIISSLISQNSIILLSYIIDSLKFNNHTKVKKWQRQNIFNTFNIGNYIIL